MTCFFTNNHNEKEWKRVWIRKVLSIEAMFRITDLQTRWSKVKDYEWALGVEKLKEGDHTLEFLEVIQNDTPKRQK